jgi:hypothetical protein
MMMGRTLKHKLKTLPAARRAKIERRAAELLEEEVSLRELRRALDQTQVEVARKMGVGQDAISRYEQKTDMMLSTLARYVNAMGGTLALVAEFPDRKPIRVRTLSELGAKVSRRSGSTARSNHRV